MSRPEEILKFWFDAPRPQPEYLSARGKIWFGGGEALDREIRQKFGPDVELAAHGKLGSWKTSPRSCLALIILLDQFALNIFRDQARGYELSESAIPIAESALDQGFHRGLHPVEKSFYFLPLEHAEELSLQKRCVSLYASLVEECRGEFWETFAKGGLEWAERHLRVVEQFGRFPHRNSALGRASSPAEIEFLKKGVPF